MDLQLFVKGLIIGFSIALPVGPIGILCIRRSVAEGQLYGLVSGLGAATADAIYGFIAAFGLTIVATFLVQQQNWLRLIGGIFLVILGIRTLLAKPAAAESVVEGSSSMIGAYTSTFLLTVTNPVTILSFAAIFSGIGLINSDTKNLVDAASLVFGVFLGSATWWLILSFGASFFRNRIGPAGLIWLNRISGFILIGFGLGALGSIIFLTFQ